MTEQNRVTIAAATITPYQEPTHEKAVRLTMMTEDGQEVSFDLSLVAISLIGMTMSPTLQVLKGVFAEDLEKARQARNTEVPDTLPEGFGD